MCCGCHSYTFFYFINTPNNQNESSGRTVPLIAAIDCVSIVSSFHVSRILRCRVYTDFFYNIYQEPITCDGLLYLFVFLAEAEYSYFYADLR